jgi:hypothetical protein
MRPLVTGSAKAALGVVAVGLGLATYPGQFIRISSIIESQSIFGFVALRQHKIPAVRTKSITYHTARDSQDATKNKEKNTLVWMYRELNIGGSTSNQRPNCDSQL